MNKKTIVIIDDNKILTQTLRGLLEFVEQFSDTDFKVFTAHNGIEGLGHVYVNDFDVIVVDSTLPKYSGMEVTQLISSNDRIKNFGSKIITLSQSGKVGKAEGLSKLSPDFIETFLKDAIGYDLKMVLRQAPLGNLVYKISKLIVSLANRSDLLLFSAQNSGLLSKILKYLAWFLLQLALGFAYLLSKIFMPHKKDEEIEPKDKNSLKYRVMVYPTLATLIATLIFLLIQVGLYVGGGITILSVIRLQSIFAVQEDTVEYIFDTNSQSSYDFDSELIQIDQNGARLAIQKPQPEEVGVVEEDLETLEESVKVEEKILYVASDSALLTIKSPATFDQLHSIREYSSLNTSESSTESSSTQAGVNEAITYQLSPNGADWYYWDGEFWSVTSQSRISTNTIQQVNENLGAVSEQFGTGEIYLRVFLYSASSETSPILSKIEIDKSSSYIESIDETLPIQPIALEEVVEKLDFNEFEVKIFNASYVNGEKVVLGKVLNLDKAVKATYEISDEELEKYFVNVHYANGDQKGELIGSAELYRNSRGEIEFLLRIPSQPGGYVTAEVVSGEVAVSRLASPVENSTFTIDSTGDQTDLNAGDGLCITSVGTCTLRAAIEESNALAGSDNLYFNIPTSDTGYRDYDLPDTASSGDSTGGDDYWTIRPATIYPNITGTVNLDGATETTNQFDANVEGPEIEVKGISTTSLFTFTSTAPNSDINFLVVNNITGTTSNAAIYSDAADLHITNNYIGVSVKGVTIGNSSITASGVTINGNLGNHIGHDVTDGNVIAGFRYGVRILGSASLSERNYVRGNFIGLGSDGNTVINNGDGIWIGSDCKVEIGGDSPDHRNYISGSTMAGISEANGISTLTEVYVYNNFFGTDVTGTLNRANIAQDMRIQGGGTSVIQRIGGVNKGNLMRFNPRSLWLNSTPPMDVVIEYNTISDQTGSRAILLNQVDNNTIIQNNALGAFSSDPYFGLNTGGITGIGIHLNSGGTPIIRGNLIQGATTHGIGTFVGSLTTRTLTANNTVGAPVIGGQNPLAGSLCNGLEQNCIRNSGQTGIYSEDAIPFNEDTLWADNDFSGGNGTNGDRNIEQVWLGLFELNSGSSRRTDLTGLQVTFPENTMVRTSSDPASVVTSATAINVTCLGTSGVSCPTTGHTSGTLDNTHLVVPSGATSTLLNTAGSWFRITEYIYDSEGNKIDYSSFKFDQPHIASGTFTFDADSSDNILNTGSARTIDGQDYTDRGEPWTDKPLATRDISTNNLGRYQIMELELVDANPVEQEDGSYVIMVDSTEDTALAAGTAYYNDGAGTASGGMTHLSTSVLANGKTSLREAIAVSNTRTGLDKVHFNIPETESGFINPDGSRTSTAEPAGTYPSTTLGYFILSHTGLATFTDSIHIDGSTMSGTTLNTAVFGDTLNANLRIQLLFPTQNQALQFNSSGNTLSGLNLRGFNTINNSSFMRFITSDDNWIYGNYIGSEIDGTINSNYRWGRMSFETGSADNIVGTNGDGVNDISEKNLITGYSTQGMIWVSTLGPGGKEASGNVIAGNYVRTDKTGRYCNPAMFTGNDRSAITVLSGANATRIGTNEDGISDSEEANILACVFSDQSYTQNGTIRLDTHNNFVVGNYINTNPHGDNLNPNPIVNGNSGIKFQGNGNLIKGNIVKFSSSHGIYGRVSVFYNNQIIDNIVEQNREYGIYLDNTNVNQLKNTISLNRVTNNTLDGIKITQSNNNQLSQNSVFDNNGKLDINLVTGSDTGLGVTNNDSGDVDTGPNNLMNYPEITGIEYLGGGQYAVNGTLDNTVSGEGPFEIEVCLSSSNASGHGGCSESLGILEDVVQNMSGETNWSTVVTVAGDDGTQEREFTTLATNALGSTSEFSANASTLDESIFSIKSYPITLTYPTNSIIIDETAPLLQWEASADPDLKEYQVYFDGTMISTATTNSYKHAGPLLGEHKWHVVATRQNDTQSGLSAEATFTITPATELQIVYPQDGSTTTTMTPFLDWNASSEQNATQYEITIDGAILVTTEASSGTNYQILSSQALSRGTHSWFVRALSTGLDSTGAEVTQETGRTATAAFTVEPIYTISDPTVKEVAVLDGAYQKLIIEWEFTGTNQLAAGDTFTLTVLNSNSEIIFEISGLSTSIREYEFTPEQLALLDPNQEYFFKITLLDSQGQSLSEGESLPIESIVDIQEPPVLDGGADGSGEDPEESDKDDDTIDTQEIGQKANNAFLIALTFLLPLVAFILIGVTKKRRVSKRER